MILQGDCRETLKTLTDKSVHTCVTSPPYWGLRDYGESAQLGLEDTPEKFVDNLVEVFREVRRVLRDDGTVWLNLGDSYVSGKSRYSQKEQSILGGGSNNEKFGKLQTGGKKDLYGHPFYKDKDLAGIPWRVAFALQKDGWYLRQDIIWHKPNPMPESVRDRCTKAHEYIFLLSKNKKYYYDYEAVKENAVTKPHAPANKKLDKSRNDENRLNKIWGADGKKNKRSVWTVTTKPFKGAHFATFPPDLIEPCILAGCPEGGTVLDPFGGSGTSAVVAVKNNRKAILCELNPDYCEIAETRQEELCL